MRFRLFVIYILLTWPLSLLSQSIPLKEVPGLPTRELYDLMIDKKGFLWITHDLGITRFDGINFINFYNQKQTSLSGTGLLEDAGGRIWFNNFTGQIFYIENEKMHLLAGYDYKNEATFPRIALYKNQLVATSKKGLFFCDTKTLKCRYVTCKQAVSGTTSLAVMRDRIIAYGATRWFIYTDKNGLTPAAIRGKNTTIVAANSSTLNNVTFRDTAFLISNPAGILSKLVATDTSITLSEQQSYQYFINTVTVGQNNVWVNTTQNTSSIDDNQQFAGYNLSDEVTDKEGNIWCSSLKKGLFVHYKQADWGTIAMPGTSPDDVVKTVQQTNGALLLGTQNGKILVYNAPTASITNQLDLPLPQAPVNIIYPLGGDDFLIGTSVNSYWLNAKTKSASLLSVAAIKQVVSTDESIFLATATGLIIFPKNYSTRWENEIKSEFRGAAIQRYVKPNFFAYKQRCRAVCYDPYSKSLYVAFKDGIYTINSKGVLPFLYKNAPVYAISLTYADGKVVIGTIDNGLIIIDHSDIKNITSRQGLSTTAVVKMKAFGSHLWVLGAGSIQVIDLKTMGFINNYNLPSISDANIADFEEMNDTAYIATSNTMYKVPLIKPKAGSTFKNYLLSVKLNNKDSLLNGSNSFRWYDNDLQFNLGVPIYHNANYIYFKYRLKDGNDAPWQVTKPGERSITFPSLMPGNYTFEAIAQHPQMGPAESPIVYKFSIMPPWWQTWWFRTLIILIITGVGAFMVRIYYLNRLSRQKIAYEKELAIQDERHRISSEMHDDIGAGLSAIKLFAGMAKTKSGKNSVLEVDKIYAMLSDLSDKIREVIWSLNVDNDSLENLLYYIQFQATKVFQYSDIDFDTDMPDTVPAVVINGVMRRNVYLIIKEMLHNALKHSKATTVVLNFDIRNDALVVAIDDNGIGIKNAKGNPDSMGLKSINQRIQTLKGKMTVNSDAGTHITLTIPLANLKGI
jgi:signal transduction histidine kinase/ligand-binding sensor domain-containing protein